MKAQVLNAKAHRAQVRAFAAFGLAAALVIAWPGRSQAYDAHMSAFHGASFGSGGMAHAAQASPGQTVRTDWHGGGGFHAAGPGYRGAYGGGWRGGYGGGWHGGYGAGGYWNHGWHGGSYGWWYINAGVWTPYPYYPFDYYPYGYYPYGYSYYAYPAPYAYAAPETPAVNSKLPPPTQSWYYCDAARAYYPYVQSCPSGWRAVAAQPAPAPATTPEPKSAPEAAPQ